MKRIALLAVLVATGLSAHVEAQVIGTYRPSLVTYYPSTTSVTPVAYHKPVPTTQYAGTQYAANPYNSYPVVTASANQVVNSTPIVQTSYVGGTSYAANYPYTTVNSPIATTNCGCAPIQTIGTTNYYPSTAVAPVAYQQPVVAPVTQVAYQQPIQTIAAENTYIDGKYYVGKGLLGRPKVYAQGQPIRNVFRRILP